MGHSRSLIVFLIVTLAIVGYLALLSLGPAQGPVSTAPTVPPASAPAPAPP
jgi:hypothetical protein